MRKKKGSKKHGIPGGSVILVEARDLNSLSIAVTCRFREEVMRKKKGSKKHGIPGGSVILVEARDVSY
ncbi:hypothetical protein KY284_001018 [Solanum tuberosum]|nr:hypothetical protein KY284_001018 [Solanum tuberosum]